MIKLLPAEAITRLIRYEHSAELLQYRTAMAQSITFNEEEWEAFTQNLKFSTLRKKEHFVVEGSVCDQFGFILKGSVRYSYIKDGTELTGYFSFENEFTSSYKSYLRQEPSINYIQALEETTLILITYTAMQRMLGNSLLAYKMERFGRLNAEYCICCYEDRISSFVAKHPRNVIFQWWKPTNRFFSGSHSIISLTSLVLQQSPFPRS